MRNLTARYSATHFTHWASCTGAVTLATAYLFSRGMSTGTAGILLAVGCLLSCVTQPVLAAIADRSDHSLLRKMLLGMGALCLLCYVIQIVPTLPLGIASVFYIIAIWVADAMAPILNAMSVAYQQSGYSINFGVARGIGTLAHAVCSLAIGNILARFGAAWMFAFAIFFRVIHMIDLLRYPALQKTASVRKVKVEESCSLGQFFLRYPWYCVSQLAVVLMAMYLSMTENYMITIMESLGGNSSHVGTALFISSTIGAPMIMCYSFLRNRWKDSFLLKMAAVGYLLRAVLVWQAQSIGQMYCIQLLHIVTFALLAPAQVEHAKTRVRLSDMVKGQAITTAAYAMGCAAGSFIGGQLLRLSVEALLRGGVVMALLGLVIILISAHKTDRYRLEQ